MMKSWVTTLYKILKKYKKREQSRRAPSYSSISEWYLSPLGRKVFEKEKSSSQNIISRLFGYHILQVGLDGNQELIGDSPAGNKIIFAPKWYSGVLRPVANCENLPLASDTIDSIVLYHALDFTNDSHELLREVTRVLRPGGQMLIIGFNPISFWGVWRLLKRKKSLPWEGRFLSMNRLSDWLRLLNLQITSADTSLHFLPFNINRVLKYADSFEKLGQKLKSPFGGSYCIQCEKQVIPITPIVSLSRRRRITAAGSSVPITENAKIKHY